MFAKIYESIYDGSLRKDWKALVVFQQFLILCDREGHVDKMPEAISARTTIPLDIIQHGIAELAKPDPESRSQEQEGRRIILANPNRSWGWIIVNYAAYRDIKNQEELRTYWRGQKNDSRTKEKIQERTIRLQIELNRLYNRKPGDRWSYLEESQLAEIARREQSEEELALIVQLRQTNGRYFPQSVERLLSGWNTTLDRARAQTPKTTFEGPPHVRLRVIEDMIASHPANSQSQYSVASPTQTQRDELKYLRAEKRTLERNIAGLK